MERISIIEREDNRWCVLFNNEPLPIFETNRKDLAVDFAAGLAAHAEAEIDLVEDLRLSPYMVKPHP